VNISTFLLSIVIGIYFVAFIVYLTEFLGTERKPKSLASRVFEAGFFFHTLQIFVYTFSVSQTISPHLYLPVGTLGENFSFFAWSLAFVYFVLVRRYQTEGFGLVLSPILVSFLIPALFPYSVESVRLPYLNNHYFLLHILSAFFAYASFALSFIAGLLYLTQDRALKLKTHNNFYQKLPSLEELERFIFRTIFWGVLLLGIAIITGGLWTKSAFGRFVLLEPKSLAAVATWIAYVLIVSLHGISLAKGRRVILISVWAFSLVLFTFIGTSVMKMGLHVGV